MTNEKNKNNNRKKNKNKDRKNKKQRQPKGFRRTRQEGKYIVHAKYYIKNVK